MNTQELKKTLVQKLQDEGTYFTASDISIRKTGNKYRVTIKGYEPWKFYIKSEHDDLFGYGVLISRYYGDTFDGMVTFLDSMVAPPFHDALMDLGYHIANTF